MTEMKVIVGSKNPTKVFAVKTAFAKMFPGQVFDVIGVDALSGVHAMPMSSKETYQGALNRAHDCKKQNADADYFVGVESGCEEFLPGQFAVTDWVVVLSKNGKAGQGNSGQHFLPKQVSKMLFEGYELSQAADKVMNEQNTGQKMGIIGLLTGDAVKREEKFVWSTVFALIPHKNPGLF